MLRSRLVAPLGPVLKPALALLLAACGACAREAPGASVGPVPLDLPAAARASSGGRGDADGVPRAVRVGDPRSEADALGRALVDALLRGDEEGIGTLFTERVEVTEGDMAEGRARVMALIRPWLPHIARALSPGVGRALSPRIYAPEECAPSTCGGVFLRRGDWFLVLPIAGLRPAPIVRTPRGVSGGIGIGGTPTTAPPRYFVLRPVEGVLRIVAVNDDLLRTR